MQFNKNKRVKNSSINNTTSDLNIQIKHHMFLQTLDESKQHRVWKQTVNKLKIWIERLKRKGIKPFRSSDLDANSAKSLQHSRNSRSQKQRKRGLRLQISSIGFLLL